MTKKGLDMKNFMKHCKTEVQLNLQRGRFWENGGGEYGGTWESSWQHFNK